MYRDAVGVNMLAMAGLMLLAGGVVSKLEPFSERMKAFYDRAGHA